MVSSIFEGMAEKWPSTVVFRTEIKSFTGGGMSEKYLANLDCLGKGPAGRKRVGRKVAYPIFELIKWLDGRTTSFLPLKPVADETKPPRRILNRRRFEKIKWDKGKLVRARRPIALSDSRGALKNSTGCPGNATVCRQCPFVLPQTSFHFAAEFFFVATCHDPHLPLSGMFGFNHHDNFFWPRCAVNANFCL